LTYNSCEDRFIRENHINFDDILKNTSFKKPNNTKKIAQEIELEQNSLKLLDFIRKKSIEFSKKTTRKSTEKSEEIGFKARNSKEKSQKNLRNSLKSVRENSSSLRFETDNDSEMENSPEKVKKVSKKPETFVIKPNLDDFSGIKRNFFGFLMNFEKKKIFRTEKYSKIG